MTPEHKAAIAAARAKMTGKRKSTTEHVIRCANGKYASIRLTRKLAMAAFCTECMGWEGNPQDCTAPLCPLYPFRAKTLRTMRGDMDTPLK